MRKALLVFGLTVAMAAPACAVAGEGKFPDLLGLKGQSGGSESAAEWSASLTPAGRAGEFVLQISVKLPPEHHIYSMTDKGAQTKIEVKQNDSLEPLGKSFVPDHGPKLEYDADLERDVEEFYEQVSFSRHFWLKAGAANGNVSLAGTVKYQICKPGKCRLEEYAFDVKPTAPSVAARKNDRESQSANAVPNAGPTQFEQLHGGAVQGTWTVEISPRQARAGDEVTIIVRAELQPRWHVYPMDLKPSADGGSLPTVVGLTELGGLIPLGDAFTGPAPTVKLPEVTGEELERFHEGRIEWSRKFKIPEGATAGDISIAGKVAWQMCKNFCLPATGFEFAGQLTIADETVSGAVPFAVTAKLKESNAIETIERLRPGKVDEPGAVDVAVPASPAVAQSPLPSRDAPPEQANAAPHKTKLETEIFEGSEQAGGIDKSQGLPLFLFAAALAGFAALLTPCVFPMIPITVSFFQKQAEKQHHRPITMASVYCLGIIGTFTGLGMVVSMLFGAAALPNFANTVVFNLFLAALLIFFGLNLLGMFEIRVPSWLLTYTAGKESKGGFIGVLFMALTFTLTSFTCTFAFAGALLVAAQNGDRLWPILGLLAFSAAFALPFFFLALFPSMLQKLPKSGGWMNVAKVIMGMIELGAAMKFLGNADQRWNGQPAIIDFHLMIAIWAVVSAAAALYLLGLFRLPHDTPSDHIGVLRFISAMSFMGFAVYLGVGLFGAEKPQGAIWKNVEALANSTFDVGDDPTGPYRKHGTLKYALNFERAFDFAIAEKKPLFLDFTGVNCANCRKMEKGPMSQPEIEARLGRFVRIQLFTDTVPIKDRTEAERLKVFNVHLQQSWFKDIALPSYVVIPPDPLAIKDRTKILSRLEGYDPDQSKFAEFLDRGWKGWQDVQARANAPVVGKR